ncbi:TetR family transcriptional regulator [Nonomuraea spiralis]|uniref:TetR family transcriptional regulator n=1 Tax=Nonomuraea spiralis TaxID=46182 RepID=A0ABV5IXS5_9ACTN|nr:TetR family transcriptional regulator [Nonomuraea spiralis]GGT21806.1 TetR family transcriptional regulator [Nonomuraea spiralis]
MAEERGRRPGNPQTRDEILEAAMRSFAAHGYGGTTIRAVARAAGVDPALVMHFFGNKDGLFEAAIKAGMPVALMVGALDGDESGLGERLVTRYLELWEDPAHGPRLAAVLHAAAATPATAALLKELMSRELLAPVARRLSGDHPEVRALLAASQLIGLAMMRYLLKVEPLASLPARQVAAAAAPNVQRYLTGALSLDETAAARG